MNASGVFSIKKLFFSIFPLLVRKFYPILLLKFVGFDISFLFSFSFFGFCKSWKIYLAFYFDISFFNPFELSFFIAIFWTSPNTILLLDALLSVSNFILLWLFGFDVLSAFLFYFDCSFVLEGVLFLFAKFWCLLNMFYFEACLPSVLLCTLFCLFIKLSK